MSSNDDEYNDGEQSLKKRRVQRACDICRRKKIRCDGGQMPGNRCSNCIAYSFECTYVEASKKRGPPKGYVERLESRVDKLEKVLTKLFPDTDVIKELDNANDSESFLEHFPFPSYPVSSSEQPNSAQCSMQHRHPCDVATTAIRKAADNITQREEDQGDDDFAHLLLADNMKNLSMGDMEKHRFFGKSSGAMLIHTAMELKNEYTGGNDDVRRPVLSMKREEFWTIRPWERLNEPGPKMTFSFPPPDLLTSLIGIFFENVNLFLPLLHRPTFERAIASGLHLTDDGFGANVLLVCAVASRYSEDPRVKLDGVATFHSGGWKWFHQVQQMKKSYLAPPSLYDMQYYCLVVMFLLGSSAPQSCWTIVGIGIRLAQDVGAHRRKFDRKNLTVEDELWKRAFWVLVTMDRMVGSTLGRPCAIQDEDFDVDLPVECDDEYWEDPDPSKRFKQPPNKPSLLTGFILLLKLNRILIIILRTIYSINKSKILLGFVGKQWDQHIVAELDSALNKWIDSIPDYLRWDPNRENLKFFQQSVSLYCTYYYIQILIHRSFIPSPRKPSPFSFPSLAICTNAARSCSHMVDVHSKRGLLTPPGLQITIFTAGVVLLLSIWSGKRSGLSTDTSREMADVHMCMQALRKCEHRWHSAGRLWDILYELAFVGDLPLPTSSPPASNKRDRDSDSPSSTTPDSHSPVIANDGLRTIAGSRRVNNRPSPVAPTQTPQSLPHVPHSPTALPHQMQRPHQQHTLPDLQYPYPLPFSSDELGRIPVPSQSAFLSSSFMQNPISPQQQREESSVMPVWGVPASVGDGDNTYNSTVSSPMFNMDMYSHLGFGISDTMDPSYFQQPSPASPPSYTSGSTIQGATPQQLLSGFLGASGANPGMPGLLDNDAVAMLTNPPSGFDLEDWGTYLANVSELTHGTLYQGSTGANEG